MRKAIILIAGLCLIWFEFIKPVIAEYYFTRSDLAKAYKYDENSNSILLGCTVTSFKEEKYDLAEVLIDQLINRFNGDVTLYAVWHLKARIEFKRGDIMSAVYAIELAHLYSPYDENINRSRKIILDIFNETKENN